MKDFNEAPASITVMTVSKNGFNPQFTIRGESMDKLLTEYETVEGTLIQKGYKPAPVKSFGGGFPKKELDFIEGRICPLDKGRLYRSTTKTGKKMIKCENNKWDFQLKKATGCTFVEWETPAPISTQTVNEFPDQR